MTLDRTISASLLRVRLRSPFFATLALHARFIETEELPTAATDGTDVFVNPQFVGSLSPAHLDGVLLHEVLHAALGHVHRRGTRDPKGWNIAADIVVNGLILQKGFTLPDGAVIDPALQGFSAEEVYAVLASRAPSHVLDDVDLLEAGPPGAGSPGQAAGDGTSQPGRNGTMQQAAKRAAEAHWRAATARAEAVTRGTGHGSLPAGAERAFALADTPTIDWRSVLWRFLAPTATDFASFDRRYVHRGLYLETLEDQNLRIAVAIDTSGSIDDEAVGALMNEVRAVLGAYPGLECWLYYADAELHGPWKLGAHTDLPPPVGGGGTDFRPFFSALGDLERDEGVAPSVCVYLTDGHGDFPQEEPDVPVLWAVVPGGLDDEQFPFGQVTRLV